MVSKSDIQSTADNKMNDVIVLLCLQCCLWRQSHNDSHCLFRTVHVHRVMQIQVSSMSHQVDSHLFFFAPTLHYLSKFTYAFIYHRRLGLFPSCGIDEGRNKQMNGSQKKFWGRERKADRMQSLLEAMKRFCKMLTVDAAHHKFVQSLEKHSSHGQTFTLCDKDVRIHAH